MIVNSKFIVFLHLFLLLFFTACTKNVRPQGEMYTLDECKQEMLNAEDYSQVDSIDLIVVEKSKRRMFLYKNYKVQGSVPISLGKDPVGTKVKQGDNKTPEGTFWISRKLCSSKYYRSLCISYPRPQDIAKAQAKGVNPGGNITIHAQPKWNADGHKDKYMLARNWTEGCVAVTNKTMNKLWYAVREGVPIVIR